MGGWVGGWVGADGAKTRANFDMSDRVKAKGLGSLACRGRYKPSER